MFTLLGAVCNFSVPLLEPIPEFQDRLAPPPLRVLNKPSSDMVIAATRNPEYG